MITMYTIHCMNCNILEEALNKANIEYELITDRDMMISKGFDAMPVLEVNGECMEFNKAMEWIGKQRGVI